MNALIIANYSWHDGINVNNNSSHLLHIYVSGTL